MVEDLRDLSRFSNSSPKQNIGVCSMSWNNPQKLRNYFFRRGLFLVGVQVFIAFIIITETKAQMDKNDQEEQLENYQFAQGGMKKNIEMGNN
ncbi:hypothetical protein CsSME_00016997 [Camellia sinensis var. sinensis]